VNQIETARRHHRATPEGVAAMMSLERLRRVLVVDDSMVTARIVAGFLTQAGVRHVDTVYSGEEALEMIAREDYSLVVSDFVMHPMTGMQLWRRLQARPEWSRIPFLLMTAQADNAALSEKDRAQLKAFAIKPFDAPTLVLRVAEVLDGHRKVA
jgi:two-component system chemotaxis response regulator CheY